MNKRVPPAWAVHLRPDSQIPLDDGAARRYLRRGSLPEALLAGGPGPALIAGDVALSHDELKRAAGGAARRLAERGVQPTIRVALFAENSAAWIVSYLGLQLLGATVVGMNPAFKEAEAEQILTDSEAAVALTDTGRQPLVEALRPRLPTLRKTARVEEIGERQGGEDFRAAKLQPESPALILYTSGTTGKPKGALLDHGNLLAQGRGVVEAWRWRSEDPRSDLLRTPGTPAPRPGSAGWEHAGGPRAATRMSPPRWPRPGQGSGHTRGAVVPG